MPRLVGFRDWEFVSVTEMEKRMAKAKTKTKKKIKTGIIVAIKKGKSAAKHMPDEVVISLDGEAKGRLLIVCGWSMTTNATDKAVKKWPLARLKLNLGRIVDDWAEEIGKGWKLEIRAL